MPLRDPTIENECVRDLLGLIADADVELHRQSPTRRLNAAL
jgi:hypothetical protein